MQDFLSIIKSLKIFSVASGGIFTKVCPGENSLLYGIRSPGLAGAYLACTFHVNVCFPFTNVRLVWM